MYQTIDNFKGFPIAMFFLMMLVQSYNHSGLSRTQEGISLFPYSARSQPHDNISPPPLHFFNLIAKVNKNTQ